MAFWGGRIGPGVRGLWLLGRDLARALSGQLCTESAEKGQPCTETPTGTLNSPEYGPVLPPGAFPIHMKCVWIASSPPPDPVIAGLRSFLVNWIISARADYQVWLIGLRYWGRNQPWEYPLPCRVCKYVLFETTIHIVKA